MKNFPFYPKDKKLTLRSLRGTPWPCILSVRRASAANSSCAGTAAAARRAAARTVLHPLEFLKLASPLPPSPNRDGVSQNLNFTTGFYYTTPNLELKKVTCGRVTDKNCSVTGLKRGVELASNIFNELIGCLRLGRRLGDRQS